MLGEYYRDRILWKLSKHRSLSDFVVLCEDADESIMHTVHESFPRITDPIFILWTSPARWTVVGSKSISSVVDSNKSTIHLDEIAKRIKPIAYGDNSPSTGKEEVNSLLLGSSDDPYWMGNNKNAFSMMNILRMFPLKNNR